MIKIADIAAEYFMGDGAHNLYLTINRDATFSWQFHGDLMRREITGEVFANEATVTLSSKTDLTCLGGDDNLVSVFWAGRSYLVPEERMVLFVSAINLGAEPRNEEYGLFYLEKDDWNKQVTESPTLPEKFTQYLLSEPISGQITEVTDEGDAWINLGVQNGLKAGMVMVMIDGVETVPVLVKKVNQTRCRIKSIRGPGYFMRGQNIFSFNPEESEKPIYIYLGMFRILEAVIR